MISGTSKRHRNVSVAKIRLTLIAIVAMQFPNLICIITSQMSFMYEEDVVLSQILQDFNFSNTTSIDLTARRAIQIIHDDLDHDDDGNVSETEGAEFIGREDFESKSPNLPGFATDKDGRITVREFWESWLYCSVHNWTVSQMVDWISYDVNLPQYAKKFRQYGISGAAMPILAGNSTVVLLIVDGIKEHRLKLWLKAMEVVLCGYTQSKSHIVKDIFLLISIGLACGGIAYALHVRRSATEAIKIMQEKLKNLQHEMKLIEEEEQWMKDNDPLMGNGNEKFINDLSFSSNSSLESSTSSNLQLKLQEMMEELSDTRILLGRAREKLSSKKWTPPSRLLSRLKETHRMELKLHEAKRLEAHRKVELAKGQFNKMKRKTSVWSSVQLLHSRQMDSLDVDFQNAKDSLREVQRDTTEYKIRWEEIERICNCSFLSSSVRARNRSTTTSPTQDDPAINTRVDSEDTGLIMKELSHECDVSTKNDDVDNTVSREHRRSQSKSTFIPSPTHSTEDILQRPHNESPSIKRKKSPSSRRPDQSASMGRECSDVMLPSNLSVSKSSHSLPGLLRDDATETIHAKFATLKGNRMERRRSNVVGGFLKKIIKQ